MKNVTDGDPSITSSQSYSSIMMEMLSPFAKISDSKPLLLYEYITGCIGNPHYATNKNVFGRVVAYFEKTVIPHKVAVWEAGMQLLDSEIVGATKIVPQEFKTNLWRHDFSKFSDTEAVGYAFHDFSSKNPDDEFERAWHHHKMNNLHHPEYWLNPNRSGALDPLDMPEIYVAEMIADWMGAGKVYGSSLADWMPGNLHKFHWTLNTALSVKWFLSRLGHETELHGTHLLIN